MKINWKVRLVNKNFWLSLIPAVLLLIQAVGAPLGMTLDFGELGNQLLAIVNAVFAVLAILGIVQDPTTDGMGDSSLAMTYDAPKKDV
jgi:phi LC3 family holin